ncbi:MAG: CpXC domain-containing protein [Chloroflexota bacterium]
MPKATQTTIQCAQCGQPVRVTVNTLIDASQDPQAKVNLLSGRLNVTVCPNCGAPNTVLTPIMYHDPAKELLLSYVPMELGLPKETQEKMIGEMMRELTSQLPQGSFKAYLLQPRQALTMQGLIDQVLQADGVTPEMMEAQRARVRLVEQFLQAQENDLPELVRQFDLQIDAQFFQTMTLIAQQLLQEGRQGVAQHIIQTMGMVEQLSSYGQDMMEQRGVQEEIVREVADAVNALGQQAQRSDFLNLAFQYADDDQRLQGLVGLIRPAFDATFFQELTVEIGKAPADQRERLETVRDKLIELTALIDQQAQMALQEAAGLLQDILSSPNPDEVIYENLPLVDYTFMQVLSANVQEATRRGDLNASARLKDIYNRVVAILQENMPPELQFVNELLSAPSDDAAREMVAQHAGEFGAGLIEAMDAVEEQIAAQGNPALLERLAFVRNETAQVLG